MILLKSTTKDDEGTKISDNPLRLGIKGGYDFDDYRVYGGYYYQTKSKYSFSNKDIDANVKWTEHNFLIGIDYTPHITDNVKLIAGVNAGLGVLNVDINTKTTTNNSIHYGKYKDTSVGYVLGLGLGGAYEIDDNNEIEAGFKFTANGYKLDGDRNLFHNYGAYIAYNYKF